MKIFPLYLKSKIESIRFIYSLCSDLKTFYIVTYSLYPKTYRLLALLGFTLLYLLLILYTGDVLYCADDEHPPIVNNARKPIYISHYQGQDRNLISELPFIAQDSTNTERVELPAVQVNHNNSSVIPENNSISSNIHELGTNTSSVSLGSSEVAVNASISSNINELGINTPSGSHIGIENRRVNTIHELGINTPSGSLRSSMIAENGSISSNRHELGTGNSIRSSMVTENGSVLPTPVVTDNGRTGYLDDPVGYLAPDSAFVPQPYDPTENTKPSTFNTIIASFDSLEKKLDSKAIKYYGMGKRKIYWKIWEKHTGRYESYRGFKQDWDPNTNILNKIYKDVKSNVKSELRDIFYLKDKPAIRGGTHTGRTSREVNDLMRRRRPFN